MDMRKCKTCGEEFSPTYRACPFCQEEEAYRRGKPMHRHSGDFRNKQGGQALGVLILVLALVVVGVSSVYLFGDAIAGLLGIRDPDQGGGTTHISDKDPDDADPSGSGGDTGGAENPGGTGGGDDPSGGDPSGEDSPGTIPEADPPAVSTPDTPVTLSSSDFTLSSAGKTSVLKATGGSGTYTWSSKNSAVATVAPDGTVTAVGGGNTEVSVTDGFTTATCIVRVRGAASSSGDGGGGTASSGTLTINREDMTMPAGSTWQLKVSGASSAVTWSIADTSIATIDADGTVHFLSKGTTTATASVDGQTLKCIVRVS